MLIFLFYIYLFSAIEEEEEDEEEEERLSSDSQKQLSCDNAQQRLSGALLGLRNSGGELNNSGTEVTCTNWYIQYGLISYIFVIKINYFNV